MGQHSDIHTGLDFILNASERFPEIFVRSDRLNGPTFNDVQSGFAFSFFSITTILIIFVIQLCDNLTLKLFFSHLLNRLNKLDHLPLNKNFKSFAKVTHPLQRDEQRFVI